MDDKFSELLIDDKSVSLKPINKGLSRSYFFMSEAITLFISEVGCSLMDYAIK